MSEPLQWVFAYCAAWALIAHVFLALRIEHAWKHHKRSKAARKAAETRKRSGYKPKPRTKPQTITRANSQWQAPQDRRTVEAKSAWFRVLNQIPDEPQPDYNVVGETTEPWHPEVRRFNGGAAEYSKQRKADGNV